MARKKVIQDAHYHDTLLLLKKYRDVVWSLTVAVEQAKSDFRECYGSSVDEFLESIYVAGADLSGTDIEERAKSIERSSKMLKFVDHAVQIMREKTRTAKCSIRCCISTTSRRMSQPAMRMLHRHWWTQDTPCAARQ